MPPDEERLEPATGDPSHFGLLLLCFFLSGLAALIYQTAWSRQFAFVFGTSELAVASVLASYMGGLALGAAVVGRVSLRIRRPVLVYGLLELAIGAAALAVPFGVEFATEVYVDVFGGQGAPADEGGLLSALFYLACSFAILLVPTALMGATLPLLARHAVRSEQEIGSRIARLYAMNTAGAVVGTVLTGFVLLPNLGLSWTVWVAVGTNAVVFAAAARLARRLPPRDLATAPDAADDPRSPNSWILPLIAVSGAVSFTYEVLWTRLLGHVLGGSVYAFATMLATFLAGIALGSVLASGRLVADRHSAAGAFAWAQLGTGLLSLAAFIAIDATPFWMQAVDVDASTRLLLDAAISAAILLPATLCIGASFPLAVRILARSQEEASPASARVYAWNTVGAIAGAVGAGFFLIPAVGYAWSIAIAVGMNAALTAMAAWRTRPRTGAALWGALALVAILALLRPEPPWNLLRTGVLQGRVKEAPIVYFGVGRSATVLLQRVPHGWSLSSNGLPEATITEPGVRAGRYPTIRWLASLPAWGRPEARSIMVVGLGGGLVVESIPDSFEKIDVVEIESEMIRANEVIAAQRAQDPLADPRVQLIVNDARSALMLTSERYDAIVSQPSHPWTASASHLYTREFFQLVKAHLQDDGVFVQWMGLGFIDEDLLRSLVATLQDVFPHVRLYRPGLGGLLFSASAEPFEPERFVEQAIQRAPTAAAELGVHGAADVAAQLLLDETGSRTFAAGAAIITDDRNLLQMGSPQIARSEVKLKPDRVLSSLDPLVSGELAWDRSYLVRRVLASSLTSRAKRLARAATEPVERQVALGLIAGATGRPKVADTHFRRALEQDPGNVEAQVALLALHRRESTVRLEVLGVEPTAVAKLLASCWEQEAAEDWESLRGREAELRAIHAHNPAFLAATRLRVAWRIGAGSREEAAQALPLLDAMIPLGGTLSDLLLRARAAAAAGQGDTAASSLVEMLRKARGPAADKALRGALRFLAGLPDSALKPGERRSLETRLKATLRARRPTQDGSAIRRK